MLAKMIFENNVREVIKNHEGQITKEEMAEILWELANNICPK